ncbi:uncharacterized protein B0P05DRAFT_541910 [Gilbertella persicaria]|uniref:uncharacterized protein n=1 Tax=Gilbertella persicaria TaxID=101096 RepID=UPI002220013C|nr:uncharacterized protein B0P05DRAFT_541910 [Gilbertella persicaria]KAI8078974.1 hypothetical protein B0P05DRAFT_541910 [Gilbertella persicaria]
MLRVASILYLEKIWSKPTNNVFTSNETSSIESNSITEDAPSSSCRNVAPSIQSSQQMDLKEQELHHHYETEDEAIVKDNIQENSSSSARDNTIISLSNSVSTIESGDDSPRMTNSLFSAPSSHLETPLTQFEKPSIKMVSSPPVPPAMPGMASGMIQSDCLYYDSDLDLGEHHHKNQELITPPPTPKSSKLSPKRILHRARSSITEESVKKIGRRTSMFLERFNPHHEQVPPVPSLITNTSDITENLPPTPTSPPSSLQVFRRKSSKLSSKGKNLSKKIRKVISFHH